MRLYRLWTVVPIWTCVTAAAPLTDPVGDARAAFAQYDLGWRTYDSKKILAAFAPEFEWVNSVGLRFNTKAKLANFLDRLFENPKFRAGTPGPLVINSIKLLSPNVVVVSSSEVTDGQKVWDTGKTVPHQHTNELTVMQRFDDRWLIVSDLTSDEANGI